MHMRYKYLTIFILDLVFQLVMEQRFWFSKYLKDQINPFSGIISNTTIDPSILMDNIMYFDYSSSCYLCMKSQQ